jgi:hypothetical protein
VCDRSFCLGRLHGTGRRRREQKEGGQAERCDEEQHDMSTLESKKGQNGSSIPNYGMRDGKNNEYFWKMV